MTRDDPVSVLKRWRDYGGRYRVLELSSAGAVIELCTCHGEAVDRLESCDAALVEYLREYDDDGGCPQNPIARLQDEEAV